MPKQKQKQSQVTKVTVKVGDTVKAKRKSRARRAPAPRQPSSIGITLQGSSLSLPPPPTQQYNELVQQVDALRRQMALSGSLIPRAATNDIFNRVQATNPFANVNTAIPMATLIRPEGLVEEQVEGSTTQDAYVDGTTGEMPIDQDFILNWALANKAQSLGATSKIGVVENFETVKDINNYDFDERYRQRELELMSAEDLSSRSLARQRARAAVSRQFSSEQFTPSPSKARGRPRKMGKG